jgi:hypothetical protein
VRSRHPSQIDRRNGIKYHRGEKQVSVLRVSSILAQRRRRDLPSRLAIHTATTEDVAVQVLSADKG